MRFGTFGRATDMEDGMDGVGEERMTELDPWLHEFPRHSTPLSSDPLLSSCIYDPRARWNCWLTLV